LDREIISKEIESIERALGVLERHRNVKKDDLERSMELRWTVERGLEVTIQAVFNIAAHLLAADFKNDWDDYTSLLEKLGVHGIVPMDFADKFKAMAGFRNILVHEYAEIDLNILAGVLNNELDSFRRFVAYVLKHMEKK
jgi:uncharacterized protein YutE (UPF0331/DUF86 family)